MTDKSCRDAALSILGRRIYSETELRRKLNGYEPSEIDEVIEELYELSLLDDQAFAEMILRHYAGRGYGAKKIRYELYSRGVDREIIASTLEDFEPALDVLDRLASRSGDPERAIRTLQRRGFSWDEIRETVARNFEEEWDE